jgi:hypothetical protein
MKRHADHSTKTLGLASSLGSCELVTDSSDGFAVNAWRHSIWRHSIWWHSIWWHGIKAVRHLRCLIASYLKDVYDVGDLWSRTDRCP